MKLVLKRADFSADNIGQVPVKKPLDADTKSILALYSATPSVDVKYALNTFIIGAKSLGVFEKLKALYLPFLASSIDEAIINVKGGTTMVNKEKLAFRNKGLTLTTPSNSILPQVEGLSLTQDNYMLSCFNNETITKKGTNGLSSGQVVFSRWGNMYTFSRQAEGYTLMGIPSAQGKLLATSSNTDAFAVSSKNDINRPLACTLASSPNEVLICANGIVSKKSGETPTTAINIISLLGYNGSASWGCENPYGLLAIGEAIDEATVYAWNALIDAMMSVVLA